MKALIALIVFGSALVACSTALAVDIPIPAKVGIVMAAKLATASPSLTLRARSPPRHEDP